MCAMECYSHEGGKNATTADEKGTLHYCNQPHEASFEYTDAGATCSDVIDGDTPVQCDLSYVQAANGEDANRVEDFAVPVPEEASSSCERQLVNANRVGTYVITYKSQNSVGKWNDESTCRGGYNQYVRSVIVEDTLRPVITLITTAHRSPRAQRSNTWHNKHILAVGKPTTLTSQRYATARRSKNYTGAGLTAGTRITRVTTAVTAWDRRITLMGHTMV